MKFDELFNKIITETTEYFETPTIIKPLKEQFDDAMLLLFDEHELLFKDEQERYGWVENAADEIYDPVEEYIFGELEIDNCEDVDQIQNALKAIGILDPKAQAEKWSEIVYNAVKANSDIVFEMMEGN